MVQWLKRLLGKCEGQSEIPEPIEMLGGCGSWVAVDCG